MQTMTAWIGAGALWVAAVAIAEDDYPIHVYPVPAAEAPLTVDGKLDEPAWQTAPVVSGFTLFGKPDLAPAQTSFRVLYDRENLYLGIVCDEPEMGKLSPVTHARDEHGVFSAEAVEIFLDPGHTHDLYYQSAVSSAGSLYDSEKENPVWNGNTRVGVSLGKDAWSLEVAFAWKDFGVTPETGAIVGLNICRDRQIGEARQWSNWARVKGGFHDPVRFGHLVLSGTPELIAKLASEFRKGDRTGPVLVFSAEGFSQTTYAALAAQGTADLEKLLTDLDAERQQEKDAAAATELSKRLEQFRQRVTEMQAEGKGKLDAATWTKLDIRIQQTMAQLRQSVWEARLSALLSGI